MIRGVAVIAFFSASICILIQYSITTHGFIRSAAERRAALRTSRNNLARAAVEKCTGLRVPRRRGIIGCGVLIVVRNRWERGVFRIFPVPGVIRTRQTLPRGRTRIRSAKRIHAKRRSFTNCRSNRRRRREANPFNRAQGIVFSYTECPRIIRSVIRAN